MLYFNSTNGLLSILMHGLITSGILGITVYRECLCICNDNIGAMFFPNEIKVFQAVLHMIIKIGIWLRLILDIMVLNV